jgi:hypothetical protein
MIKLSLFWFLKKPNAVHFPACLQSTTHISTEEERAKHELNTNINRIITYNNKRIMHRLAPLDFDQWVNHRLPSALKNQQRISA